MRVTAVRELFEETGVLLARGAERLGRPALAALRRRLLDGAPFSELLAESDLRIDAASLAPAGRWVTPAFSPRRFDTWFFTAWLPEGQAVELGEEELDSGEWLRPAEAVAAWATGRLLVAPPVLHAMRTLAGGLDDLEARFVAIPEARRGDVRRIEFRPGIILYPVRTPTRPPATHTNCYVVGHREFVVIDPTSKYDDECEALAAFVDGLVRDEGRRFREIVLTHRHPDHIGGANDLRERFGVPIAAHRSTADDIASVVRVDRYVEDGERFELAGDPHLSLVALHTPGHARGHLCFFEERTGSLITGDLVVGLGTVVIDPPEGNMVDYLRSLERVRSLGPTAIFGGHGPAVGPAVAKIDEYVAHRLEREAAILAAVDAGARAPEEIVSVVYAQVAPALHALAARSVLAHLEKLEAEGRVRVGPDGGWGPQTSS
jgi:glyoxylase-like metal-dependent hydrolase (beta-lactamase superfamily II)/8-oxo-dGTP pyrophosphatase MutT (NUDIX family)